MPDKRPSVKNERQYEALKDKGMSKERAARIANTPGASSRGGKKSGSGGKSKAGRDDHAEEGGRAQGRQSLGAEEVVEVVASPSGPALIRPDRRSTHESGIGPVQDPPDRGGSIP